MQSLIEQATPAAALTVSVKADGATRVVRVSDVPEAAVWVNVAVVQPRAETDVRRGENGGRQLQHVNVVRVFGSVKRGDDGTAEVSVTVPEDADGAFLAIYAQKDYGPVLAAARADL